MEEKERLAFDNAEQELSKAIDNYIACEGRILAIFGEDGFTSAVFSGSTNEILDKLLTTMKRLNEVYTIVITAATAALGENSGEEE